MMATEQEIREVKRRYSPQLLSQPVVAGVGIEKDEAGSMSWRFILPPTIPKNENAYPTRLKAIASSTSRAGRFGSCQLAIKPEL
jgi:hypothetical protein